MVNGMYTVKEFAQLKGMNKGSVHSAIHRGRIKANKISSEAAGGPGLYYLIPPGEVEKFKKSTRGAKPKSAPKPTNTEVEQAFSYKSLAEALKGLRETANAMPRGGALADLVDLLSAAVAEWVDMHFSANEE